VARARDAGAAGTFRAPALGEANVLRACSARGRVCYDVSCRVGHLIAGAAQAALEESPGTVGQGAS